MMARIRRACAGSPGEREQMLAAATGGPDRAAGHYFCGRDNPPRFNPGGPNPGGWIARAPRPTKSQPLAAAVPATWRKWIKHQWSEPGGTYIFTNFDASPPLNMTAGTYTLGFRGECWTQNPVGAVGLWIVDEADTLIASLSGTRPPPDPQDPDPEDPQCVAVSFDFTTTIELAAPATLRAKNLSLFAMRASGILRMGAG